MKNFNLYIIYVSFCLSFPVMLNAQEENGKEVIEQKIEELSSRYDLVLDYSDLVEMLYYYYQNPLNLNSATAEELKSLGVFSPIQINNFLEFRRKNGYFKSIYELKDIDDFPYLFIMDIKIFVMVAPISANNSIKIKNIFKYGRSDLFLRYGRVLEAQKGFAAIGDSALTANPNSHYLGSPNKIYFRYKFNYSDRVSVALVGDKDAGEELFKGSNKYGFDFYSGHIYLRDLGKVKAIVLGDYHLEFGQGLTLWSGVGFGKSVDVLGVQKVPRGLNPNSSANENIYFRGAAASFRVTENSDLTVFYSNKNLDAGLLSDTLSAEDFYFQSIQVSGLHRTPSEVAKKNAVNEQIFGENIAFNKEGFHIGATAYKTIYDKELIKSTQPYQIYDFQGKSNVNSGADFSYSLKKFGVFGELSASANGAYAFLGGLLANFTPRVNMSLIYRDFAVDYQVVYAVPFAEASGAKNEKGLFLGSSIFIGNKSSLKTYYDIFSFPWLRYRVNSPSQGNEFLAQFNYEVSRYFNFYILLKSETKMLNNSLQTEGIISPSPVEKQSLRFNARYIASNEVTLKSRVEASSYHQQTNVKKFGYAIYQDVKYKSQNLPLDFSFRYAIFSTDDYDTRIYAYESDVLYKFSVPGYYYKGQRYYLLFHWDVMKNCDFWLRFSQSIFFDKTSIGSNIDFINGNKKSEITAQIRLKF